MAKVICISGKARHGKDTSAQFFQEELERRGYNTIIVHFADLLKWMCQKYFGWDGQKDDYGRSLLQYVGTDIVRSQKPDFWADFVADLVELFSTEWDYVIVPDCRFPNEIETFKAHGIEAIHIRVHRPNFNSGLTAAQQTHISELALDDYPYDCLLTNTTFDLLRCDIERICNIMTERNIKADEKQQDNN